MTAENRARAGGWRVDLDAGDDAAYAALAGDRAWNGYSIADLVPPFREHTRVALAWPDGAPTDAPAPAACLFLRHPAFCSTIPHGDPVGVAATLDAAAARGALPAATYILTRDEHRALVERYYEAPDGWREMWRLAANAATFRPPTGADAPVARLGPDDLPALLDLYADYDESAFNADQLRSGVFYGVREGDALLAAGGTHVSAARYGLAAVGNVYTRPAARGRGYAAAVTAAVVRALLDGGCADVILNVAAGNDAARRIYDRLGFRAHCRYWEGRGVRRAAGNPPPSYRDRSPISPDLSEQLVPQASANDPTYSIVVPLMGSTPESEAQSAGRPGSDRGGRRGDHLGRAREKRGVDEL